MSDQPSVNMFSEIRRYWEQPTGLSEAPAGMVNLARAHVEILLDEIARLSEDAHTTAIFRHILEQIRDLARRSDAHPEVDIAAAIDDLLGKADRLTISAASGRLACGARNIQGGYVTECHLEAMHAGSHRADNQWGGRFRWEPVGELPGYEVVANCREHGPKPVLKPTRAVRVEPLEREDGSMGWLVVHHSLDGRELNESSESEVGRYS